MQILKVKTTSIYANIKSQDNFIIPLLNNVKQSKVKSITKNNPNRFIKEHLSIFPLMNRFGLNHKLKRERAD